MEIRTDLKNKIIRDETLRYCEIYKITNTINQKVYIGQAVSHRLTTRRNYYNPHGMELRFRAHISEAYSNRKNQSYYLNNAIRKYGTENFSLQLIKNCSLGEADKFESEEILKNNSLFPNGYNLTSGGRSFKPTEEFSKKLSNSIVNYFKDKRSEKFKDIDFNENECDFHKFIKPLNKNGEHLGWYISINKKITAFSGKHISLEESKKMAFDFLKYLKEKTIVAKHLADGNPLKLSLPLTLGNNCEELS